MPLKKSENRKGVVSIIANLPLLRRVKIIKELFIKKLDKLYSNLFNLDKKADILLQNDTPLLKASLAIIQSLKSIRQDIQQNFQLLLLEFQKNFTLYLTKLSKLESKVSQLEESIREISQSLEDNHQAQQQNFTKVSQLEESIREISQSLEDNHQAQQQNFKKVLNVVDNQSKVILLKNGFSTPEIGLMCYLYSYLPHRRVIDIGANIGETSKYLLKAGYEVYAFEPFPPVFQKLNERIGNNSNFHSYQLAVGASDEKKIFYIASDKSKSGKYKDSTLYNSLVKHSMPDELSFVDTISVDVRSLSSLHDSLDIPSDIGLVKIDTEGYDIEVIRGMADYRYPVVVAEFWDAQFPFGRFGAMNQLEGLVSEMNSKGYNWYIVLYQVWGNPQFAFYCNYSQSVENSWGNIFFFQEYDVFSKASMWCSATLPTAFFF
ncbi:MAG TPA: hypothetical protein DCF68_23110 [Cyanothece sp. UBA12306]|nr:hypothetical protein [Cyanothece sp. UBA12306]